MLGLNQFTANITVLSIACVTMPGLGTWQGILIVLFAACLAIVIIKRNVITLMVRYQAAYRILRFMLMKVSWSSGKLVVVVAVGRIVPST